MATLELLIGIAFVIGMTFFMVGGHMSLRFAGTWREFLASFCPAAPHHNTDTRSRPCVLSINNKNVGNEAFLHHFSPHVLASRDGLVFTLRPERFPATPVLVRYDQIKSFARVQSCEGEWIIEFIEADTHCWAHLPAPLFEQVCAYANEQLLPAFRVQTLVQTETLQMGRNAAAILEKELGCSPWVAEMLETLEDRDPLDAYNDVNALWKSTHEYVHELTWKHAELLTRDPSTSYWLRGALTSLREQMGDPATTTTQHHVTVMRDATTLLQMARARMDTALGRASPSFTEFRQAHS